MPQTYRPIRTVASAVPDRLESISTQISDLSSVTSGQINGTLAQLKRTVATMPLFATIHREATSFAPGGSAGRVVASGSVQVPTGKTACHVMASVTGLAFGDGVQSNAPAARIRVNGRLSPFLAAVPANMDGRFLLGSHTVMVDVSRDSSVTVEAMVYGQGPAVDTRLSLDVILSFTT